MASNKLRCGCPHGKGYCFNHSKYKIGFMMKSKYDQNKYFASYFKEEKINPNILILKMYNRLKSKIDGDVNKVILIDNSIDKIVSEYKIS